MVTDSRAPAPREPSNGSLKARLLFLSKLAISLSLIVYLFSLVDLSSMQRQFAELSLIYVGIAVALLLCQSLLSALKWRTLLVADGVALKYTYLLRTYLIGNFISLFLPTSFGGDVYRVMAVRRAAMNTAKTTSSVLFDRLTGLFALLSLAFLGYISYPGLPFKWLAIAGYIGGLVVFWMGSSGWMLALIKPTTGGLLRKLRLVLESFQTYAKNRRCLFTALAISFAFQLNIVVINKMYSLGFGLDIPFTVLLTIIPLVYLTEIIPLSINGLGFREGAFVFFYQLVGQTAEAGLGVALLVLTLRYAIGLIGGVLLVVAVITGRAKTAADHSKPGQKRSSQ